MKDLYFICHKLALLQNFTLVKMLIITESFPFLFFGIRLRGHLGVFFFFISFLLAYSCIFIDNGIFIEGKDVEMLLIHSVSFRVHLLFYTIPWILADKSKIYQRIMTGHGFDLEMFPCF